MVGMKYFNKRKENVNMTIYNYDETKVAYIPPESFVSIECKITHKSLHNFGPLKPYPACISITINNMAIYSKSLIHDENDSDRSNIGNYYTEEEEKQEIEKAKLVVKDIMRKMGSHNRYSDYFISKDCHLKNLYICESSE